MTRQTGKYLKKRGRAAPGLRKRAGQARERQIEQSRLLRERKDGKLLRVQTTSVARITWNSRIRGKHAFGREACVWRIATAARTVRTGGVRRVRALDEKFLMRRTIAG